MAPGTALIVIDMLNRYEHDDADTLRDSVEEVLPVMQALIARARPAKSPSSASSTPPWTPTSVTSKSSSPATPWRTFTSTSLTLLYK
ncbi:MAG TPA: hypothetical protein VIC06_13350 [Solirubrobacteraceae bacterium]|jgi:nicotinamidase-related amidase